MAPETFLLVVLLVLAGTAVSTSAETIKSEVKMNLEEFEEIFSSARLNEAEQRVMEQKRRNEAEHQRKIKELDEAIQQSRTKAERDRFTDYLATFPENYKVLTQKANGLFNASAPSSGPEGDVASFEIELIVRVMSTKWTTVPIVNTTSTVASDWKVSWMAEDANDDKPASLAYVDLDPVADPQAMLLVRDEQQVLATNRTGLFRVQFIAHSRVRKDRKLNSVSLSSLLYPLSDSSMRLCTKNTMDTPEEELTVKELSVNPTSAVLRVRPENGCALINVILPLTSSQFEINWLDIVDVAKEKKGVTDGEQDDDQREESLVTVVHDAMHTVEEGVVRSTNVLQFETTADTLTKIEFKVHGPIGTRVTSVSGYGLSRWAAGPFNSTESMIPVSAYFKRSNLVSSQTLHVDTETDTDTKSKQQTLDLARIECVDVLRQSGHIGVIKNANNVELHQSKAVGLARAEPSDISSQLRLNVGKPVFLSYKYLNPSYDLKLRSTSHSAMDTLEAVADRVHYEALVMDSMSMHSLLVMMKSTKLQYLELRKIPSDASMFTLLVNGVQTKPVRGESADESSLLIPLLVGPDIGETANDGLGAKTSIELRFFSRTHDPLGEEGSLVLHMPQVTLPISVVTVELRLPKAYSYNFTGDFGDKGADRLKYQVPSAFSYVKGKRMVPKDYKFSRLDDMVDDEVEAAAQGKGSIQMDIPQSGKSYCFSRLLVVDTPLSLNVTYYPPPTKPPNPSLWGNVKSFLGVNNQ